MNKSPNSSYAAIVAVFFFWGFLAASNGIFIPFCKAHFHLSQFQSQLVDSAFYGAYFIGSLLLYLFSLQTSSDLILRIGYKKTIIYGLLLSVLGALAMIPALGLESFASILAAFFIIALGFSLQQTSANPLILNLGDPAKGSHRLNFAGSINSFGTTLGPVLVSLVLFGKAVISKTEKENASIGSVTILYIILAAAFIVASLILRAARLPSLSIETPLEKMKILKGPMQLIIYLLGALITLIIGIACLMPGITGGNTWFLAGLALFLSLLEIFLIKHYKAFKQKGLFETQSFPQIIPGMIAIFVYVGVEVTIQSNLGSLLALKEYGGLNESQVGPYVALYWGSLMIGRWTGSLGAFNLKPLARVLLTIVVPFCAFALALFMNYLGGTSPSQFIIYGVCVVLLIAAFFAGQQKPALTLMLFSLLGVAAMLVGLLSTGKISTFAFMSGGLFCSVMWPCIFSLATAGLGSYTGQASTFLIMMILGGAILPPLQGWIADESNIHFSYTITLFCFAFLAWYSYYSKKILRARGIDFDAVNGNAH